MKLQLGMTFLALMAASLAQAATVYTGDVIQGKRVISQRDAMIEPGTRVVQVLYDSPDAKCDGDGCGEEEADYVE